MINFNDEDIKLINKGSHPFVKLAWASIISYVKFNRVIDFSSISEFLGEILASHLSELNERHACFVSLKKDGELRGCMGTIEPQESSLAQEIIENAISAATKDPRFPPLAKVELPSISVSIDVLTELEPASFEALSPQTKGLLVVQEFRRGLLLPNLEGIDTPEIQLEMAARKAGIDLTEPYRLFTFTTTRLH